MTQSEMYKVVTQNYVAAKQQNKLFLYGKTKVMAITIMSFKISHQSKWG